MGRIGGGVFLTGPAVAFLLAAPMIADAARSDGASPPAGAATSGPSDAGTLVKDRAIVDAAEDALHKGGILALKDHLPALEQVMADAPKPFRKTEEGGGRSVYRANDPGDCLLGLLSFTSQQKAKGGPAKSADCVDEPYTQAALLIGSYHNEVGEADAALAALDAGLAVAPDDPKLISEKGASFTLQHRWADGLATYSAGFAAQGPLARATDRARLLRGEGFALTELKRLDQAVAAYKASLELEPDNAVAVSELKYIAGLKAGAAPEATGLTTAAEAKKRK